MNVLKKPTPLLFVFCLTFMAFQAQAFEAWWQCQSRQGGDWSFGRAPSICLVDHMQTQSSVKNQYSPLLFQDTSSRSSERNRYMTELNALAKEVARYYIKKRKPSVSENEIQAFTKGLLTLMHQETVWSHYRQVSDSQVRYMRGDSGHGHGLMQVDDRSHQTALLQGRGVDLIKNMIYGLDVFYAAWERAPQQSCLSSATNYTDRIRSAWAAYNGGPARICRWTSSTGTFAHHDKQFYDKLKKQTFKNYVTSESKKTSLDINCLAEGSRPCANNGTPDDSTPVSPIAGELYKVGAGLYCLYGSSQLECVDRLNDVTCMELRDNRTYSSRGTLTDAQVSGKSISRLDRNTVCQQQVSGLFEISQTMELKKNINIRRTPAGERLGTISSGTTAQILDFEITTRDEQKRYYKMRQGNIEGYIYAGDEDDYLEWAVATDDGNNTEPTPIAANIGDSIEVVAPFGINQRQTPGGTLIQRIPNGTVAEVLDRVVRGSQNFLYYKVSYQNQEGYIYSGYLTNEDSVLYWTEVLNSAQVKSLSLASDQSFRFLKDCPESSCSFSKDFIRSGNPADQVQILQTQGDWVQVSTRDGAKTGWILSRDLVEAQ